MALRPPQDHSGKQFNRRGWRNLSTTESGYGNIMQALTTASRKAII